MEAHLIVVPHSHWDREWYLTYENMRFYLVQFMDRLIEVLEKDATIPGFLLDGQMILVDDYLEIRPEMEARLRNLAAAGRLTLGPWYVQPDEFLVSGEALVRNLQIGLARSREFGRPMLEGYVPDTFGHVEQLPQILKGFGIGSFYTMRGIREDIDEIGTEFLWQAPDGSTVLTHFLAESYSNGGVVGMTPETSFVHHGKTVSYDNLFELVARMDRRSTAHVLLVLNGSDHTALQEDVGAAVRSLSRQLRIRLGLLEDFRKEVEAAGKVSATVRGELRYGRYQPVFKGVFSTRIYLKQLAVEAEEALAVEAERFSLMAATAGLPVRQSFLSYSWKLLIQNHAHDSICGCSIDAVHDENVTRLRKSIEVANAVASEALEALAVMAVAKADLSTEGVIPIVVFNPSPWVRSGTTRVTVHPIAVSPLGARRFGFSEPQRDFALDSCILESLDGEALPFSVAATEVTVEDVLLRRKVLFADTIEFEAKRVPAMGYRLYRLRRPDEPQAEDPDGKDRPTKVGVQAADNPARDGGPVALREGRLAATHAGGSPSGRASLDNGLVRVELEQNGTLSVHDYESGGHCAGLNLFLDEGDAGDEYSFSAPSSQEILSSKMLDWSFEAGENRLIARATLAIPRSLSPDRRSRSRLSAPCRIVTAVTIESGSRLVRVCTSFENGSADHRLRVAFPTGIEATESVAETAFGLTSRPTALERVPDDRELPSGCYPQRRFVAVEHAGRGFALFNKGLPEYEVTPDGEVMLTLLRSVGWLSRSDLLSRPGQVGPELPTPGAQCLGSHQFEYAFMLFAGRLNEHRLFRTAEEYLHPLVSRAIQTVKRPAGRLTSDSLLSIDNPNVVVSSLRADGETCILRVFNPTDVEQTFISCWGRRIERAEETELAEGPGREITLESGRSSFTASVRPAAVATFRVCFSPTSA